MDDGEAEEGELEEGEAHQENGDIAMPDARAEGVYDGTMLSRACWSAAALHLLEKEDSHPVLMCLLHSQQPCWPLAKALCWAAVKAQSLCR